MAACEAFPRFVLAVGEGPLPSVLCRRPVLCRRGASRSARRHTPTPRPRRRGGACPSRDPLRYARRSRSPRRPASRPATTSGPSVVILRRQSRRRISRAAAVVPKVDKCYTLRRGRDPSTSLRSAQDDMGGHGEAKILRLRFAPLRMTRYSLLSLRMTRFLLSQDDMAGTSPDPCPDQPTRSHVQSPVVGEGLAPPAIRCSALLGGRFALQPCLDCLLRILKTED